MADHLGQAILLCYIVCLALDGDFSIKSALWRLVQATETCHAVIIIAILRLMQIQTEHGVVLDNLLFEHLNVVFETLESNEDDREVVKRAILSRGV